MAATQFEQPVRRLGGSGRARTAGLAGAWGAGLVAVVALAVAGGGASGDDPAARLADPAETPGLVMPSEPPASIVLEDLGRIAVQTEDLHVRGGTQPPIAYVEIVLLRGGVPVAERIIRPMPDGSFSARIPLEAPRSAGTVTVLAIGRDTGGREVDAAQHSVAITALHAVLPRLPQPTRPPIGEDGLMGILGVDLPEIPGPSPAPQTWQWPVGRLAWQVNPAQR
jgi:hypothetical protein